MLAEHLEEIARQRRQISRQLEELERLDLQNRNQIQEHMLRLRQAQTYYMEAVDRFQQGKEALKRELQDILKTMHPNYVDAVIRACMQGGVSALTTPQMKRAMREGIAQLEGILAQTVARLEKISSEVQRLYRELQELLGAESTVLTPPPLSLHAYQKALQEIIDQGHAFHDSLASTLLEQHLVIRRLYEAILSRIRKLFRDFYQEVVNWGRTSLTPLIQQLKDRQQEIKRQIALFKRIQDAKTTLEAELKGLRDELNALEQDEVILRKIREQLELQEQAA